MKCQSPSLVGGHLGAVTVGTLGQLAHRHERLTLADGVGEHDAGPEHLVPFAEHGGADQEASLLAPPWRAR